MRQHSREHLYAVACAAMFVFGIILGLPGTVLGLPEVVARFGLTLADRGTLIATLFVGLLIGSFASGPVVDALGQRASLVVSAVLIAVCLPLFTIASNFALASTALAALGLAGAGFNTASNALSTDLFPEERGRRMNGIAIAVGLGGLGLPVVTALTEGRFSWQLIVLGAAGLAVIVAVAAATLRMPATAPRSSRSGVVALRQVATRPGFAWFCLLLALAGANEASTAGWTSTFLIASGFTPVAAAWGLASLWLGLIVGRLSFAGRVDRAKRDAIIRGALAGAGCVAALIATRSAPVIAIAPFAIGVSIAIVMPTSLALAGERYPGSSGTLIGTLLTLSQVGGIAVPAAIGVVAQAAGVRAGMSLLIANSGLAAVVAWRASSASLAKD